MARIYSNENVPLQVVVELRRLGHDVLTTHESGRAGIALPDDEVLSYSTAEERILITLNRRHFIRLHHSQPAHAGIVACTFDMDFAALAARISDALATIADMHGQLLRVNRPG